MKISIKKFNTILLSLVFAAIPATQSLQAMNPGHQPRVQSTAESQVLTYDPLLGCIASFLPSDNNHAAAVNHAFCNAYYSTPRHFYCKTLNNSALAMINRTIRFNNGIDSNAVKIASLKIRHFGTGIDLATMRVHNETTALEINSHSQITATQMQALIQKFPNLERLDIAGCDNAPAVIAALEENSNALINLKEINLAHANTTADLMATIARCCPNLERLDIAGCHNAPSGIVAALDENPQALHALKEINLTNTHITTGNMRQLLLHCQNLEQLNVFWCYDAPLGILTALDENPHALQALKEINLSYTEIAIDEMQIILQHCPNLEKTTIFSCSNAATALAMVLETNNYALQKLRKIILAATDITQEQSTLLQAIRPGLLPLNQSRW